MRQGVTTELIGIDGCSYAPFTSDEDFRRFVELNSGLDGNPPLPGRWSTVEQYLDMFTDRVAVNIAYIVGNSPLRIAALGWDDRPGHRARAGQHAGPPPDQRWRRAPSACPRASTTRPGATPTRPSSSSCRGRRRGSAVIYHTHVRYGLGDRFLDPFREALDIGRGSGIPVHITHFYQRTTSPGGARRMLGLVEDAREEGLDVTFDSYPYPLSSTRLLILVPQWAHDGGPERLKAVLRDPGDAGAPARGDGAARGLAWTDMWLTNFQHAHHHRFEGRSIAQVADMMDKDPVDAICELLVAENLEVSYVSAGGNAATLPKFVSHPLSMVGSDALLIGDYPSPRTYGTFPIILAEFVREERFMALPDAIRKMTSFPAQRLGPARPRPAPRRLQGRRGGLRPADGEGAGHADPAQAVPDRHRPRHRQRQGRGRRRALIPACWPVARSGAAGPRRRAPAGAAPSLANRSPSFGPIVLKSEASARTGTRRGEGRAVVDWL